MIHGSTDIVVKDSELGPCRSAVVIGGGSEGNGVLDSRYCEINKIDHFGAQPQRITVDNVLFRDYDYSASASRPRRAAPTRSGPTATGARCLPTASTDSRSGTRRRSGWRYAPSVVIRRGRSGGGKQEHPDREQLLRHRRELRPRRGTYGGRAYGRWEAFDFSHRQVANPGVYAFENVLFRFNLGLRQAGFLDDLASVGCGPDKIRNVQVIGNIGLRNSRTAGVTYRYNLYSNSGRCHKSDRRIGAHGAIPFYADGHRHPRPQPLPTQPPARPHSPPSASAVHEPTNLATRAAPTASPRWRASAMMMCPSSAGTRGIAH